MLRENPEDPKAKLPDITGVPTIEDIVDRLLPALSSGKKTLSQLHSEIPDVNPVAIDKIINHLKLSGHLDTYRATTGAVNYLQPDEFRIKTAGLHSLLTITLRKMGLKHRS